MWGKGGRIVIVGAKTRIVDALHYFLETKEFKKITVKMIVEKANINRKTFYDYFDNKEDLLNFVENKVVCEFKVIFNRNAQYNIYEIKKLIDQQNAYKTNLEICKHMKRYQAFYNNRLSEGDFYKKISIELYKILLPYLNNSKVSQYLSFGAIGYLNIWLDDDCEHPIEEVAIGLAESGLPPILRAIEKA